MKTRTLIVLKKETVYNPSDLCRTSQGLCQTAWCTTCPSLCEWGGF